MEATGTEPAKTQPAANIGGSEKGIEAPKTGPAKTEAAFDLLGFITGKERLQRERAIKVYRETLHNFTNTTPQQAERLHEAMFILGKKAEQLQADLSTVKDSQQWERIIADGAGLDPQRAEAQRSAKAHEQQMNKTVVELQEEQQRLESVAVALEDRYLKAEKAKHRLAAMKSMHGELLA